MVRVFRYNIGLTLSNFYFIIFLRFRKFKTEHPNSSANFGSDFNQQPSMFGQQPVRASGRNPRLNTGRMSNNNHNSNYDSENCEKFYL